MEQAHEKGAPPAPAALARRNPVVVAYDWVYRVRGKQALGLAFLLGLLANLAFPPIWIWPALAAALCGLVWLLDGARATPRRGRAAFWRSFAFGFGYFLGGLHWIAAAFVVDASAHLALIWMPLVLLPGGLALIFALVMRLGYRFWNAGPARLVIFAIFFTLAEWIRGALFGLGGLPWNLPGMVWEPGGAVSQSASIWGIYGLSLLTVIALAAPAAVFDSRPRGSLPSRVAPVLVAAIVFGAIWGWGARRLADIPDGAETISARLVDAGVPQSEKFEAGTAELLIQRFRALSGPDDGSSPPIVIWPEGALPYYLFEWPEALDAVADRIGDRRLIIGVARRQFDEAGEVSAYNSLAVLTGASALNGPLYVYDKHMLVPFGEFMPFGGLLEAIGLETLQNLSPGGWDAGPPPATVSIAGMPAFAPLICYEAIFPGLAPAGLDRPSWLVNISNDSWFGAFLGPYQHAAQARYRTIEEGLPMARVAVGGTTGMIDAYGRWTAKGQSPDPDIYGPDPRGWEARIVDAQIPQSAPPTPYSRYRDGIFWLMFLSMGLAFLVLPRR